MAETKLNAALLEKDQVSSDLNAMERSFSELFKRLEKYKDVVEGYKKVGNQKRFAFVVYYRKIFHKRCGSLIGNFLSVSFL